MKITVVEPHYKILTNTDGLIEHLEYCGRTCYKSEGKIQQGSAAKFIKKLIKLGHESVLEHASMTVKFVCDRACSHQLVRHRLASFSQESQRYCNYGKKGFQFIAPKSLKIPVGEYFSSGYGTSVYCDKDRTMVYPSSDVSGGGFWILNRIQDCIEYEKLLETMRPEDARSVLPNAMKTEVVVTCNMRQWRHIFRERAFNEHAQWQIRELMQGVCMNFYTTMPCLFEDLI